MAALWTKTPPPPQYTDLILCRDVFHCTPSALRAEDAVDILNALACLEAEAQVRTAEERAAAGKRRK
jgi:hypothetical protein